MNRLLQLAHRTARLGAVRELGLLALLWVAYSCGRFLADDDLAAARASARALLSFEDTLGIAIEAPVNHALAANGALALAAAFWYAALHYLVTPAVLVYLYRAKPASYGRARNALVWGSAIALVGYILLPMAPPRLLDADYVDVLALTADQGWWSTHASAPAGLGHLTNELAAMPSLHVGWTVWVAWALHPHLPRAGRLLTGLYVLGTTAVVVGTGNHWVLDAVAGAGVIGAGIVLTTPHCPREPRPDPSLSLLQQHRRTAGFPPEGLMISGHHPHLTPRQAGSYGVVRDATASRPPVPAGIRTAAPPGGAATPRSSERASRAGSHDRTR